MSQESPKPPPPPNETPLQGWKEIAAYLERDERTARRWELVEGLPGPPHPHRSPFKRLCISEGD